MKKHLILSLYLCSQLFVNAQKTVDLIQDYCFENMIGLQGANSATPSIKGYLNPFNTSSSSSSWMLAEWGSKYDLLNSKPFVTNRGNHITYFNKSKGISFDRKNNQVIIGLEVLGSKEIDIIREASDNFPGILLGQEFTSPFRVADFKKLRLTLDSRLVYVKNHMESKYNEALHTAQVTLYFSLGNINKTSKGFGDYLWFGIPIYDYRYNVIKSSWMQDTGIEGATQKFIFIPSAEEFYTGSMHDRVWKTIKKDLLVHLKEAFDKATTMGYLKGSKFEDMALTSTNFGWEMPGVFDGKFEFTNLRLQGEL